MPGSRRPSLLDAVWAAFVVAGAAAWLSGFTPDRIGWLRWMVAWWRAVLFQQ